MTITAIAIAPTSLKRLPLDSSTLREEPLPLSLIEEVKEGQSIELVALVPSKEQGHHYMVSPVPIRGYTNWWAYALHWRIEGTESDNNPIEARPSGNAAPSSRPRPPGRVIRIPGISVPVDVSQAVYGGSKFSWGEVLKGGERVPEDSTVTARVVQVCRKMDEVRAFLGNKPITITSGYRDPATNRRVGGARYSRHIQGDAVDFFVHGQPVTETFARLKGFHRSGGLAVGSGFVHLDLRDGAARWRYPGGPNVALW